MRIIKVGPEQARRIDRFGSRGLHAQALVRGDELAVTVLRLADDGEIGRHAAVVDQLFVVVEGRGAVSGDDEAWHPIAAGEAAVWRAGEAHSTRANSDLTALVVELPGMKLVEPPG